MTRVRDVTTMSWKHQPEAPAAGAEGGNGEWDDLRDFRAADFVTDDEGTGFVHCAPATGWRNMSSTAIWACWSRSSPIT